MIFKEALRLEKNKMIGRTYSIPAKAKQLCFALLLFASSLIAQTATPVLNQKVVDYITSVIGKKVDRGECWDLANNALIKVNAKWNKDYKFGKLLDTAKDEIYPGDFIQFENVVLKYEKDGVQYKETMAHHTAIVYQVISKNHYQIAHQNTGQYGRKVGLSELNLADMHKGKVKFYRAITN